MALKSMRNPAGKRTVRIIKTTLIKGVGWVKKGEKHVVEAVDAAILINNGKAEEFDPSQEKK